MMKYVGIMFIEVKYLLQILKAN